MNRRLKRILPYFILLLCLGCSSRKAKTYITAQRSEGMTTAMITFYDDGTYIIKEGTFLGDDKIKGNYSFKDSVITISTVGKNSFIESKQLLLQKDSIGGLLLRQLNSERKVDTTLLDFYANLE